MAMCARMRVNPLQMIKAAKTVVDDIFKKGPRYAKAGVMLGDFYAPGVFQLGLFDEAKPQPKSKELMKLLDGINHSGKGNIQFAGQGLNADWRMKRGQLSPRYTTQWRHIPIIK